MRFEDTEPIERERFEEEYAHAHVARFYLKDGITDMEKVAQ